MNCLNHPEAPAVGYCRECGKALCETCRRQAGGTVYCDEHVPVSAWSAPPPPPAPPPMPPPYTAPEPPPYTAPDPTPYTTPETVRPHPSTSDAGASPGL